MEAYGPDYDDLEALSERFAERISSRDPRVVGVDIHRGRYGNAWAREVLRFRWDADAEARTGVRAQDLAWRLRPVFSTRLPAFRTYLGGQTHVPVRVIVKDADRIDVARLARNPLSVRDSTYIQLAGLADFSMKDSPAGIERYNQQYKRYIRVYYMGSPMAGPELVRNELESMSLPPGYRFEMPSFSFFEKVQTAFGWILPGSLLLVFLIMAAVFESWRLSLLAMLGIPMAIIGVAAGFLLTGFNFAEGAFIGAVLLAGIVVNDTILLLDRYRKLRALRPATSSSILVRLAVRDRLWPMWTTTLTSIAGWRRYCFYRTGMTCGSDLPLPLLAGCLPRPCWGRRPWWPCCRCARGRRMQVSARILRNRYFGKRSGDNVFTVA